VKKFGKLIDVDLRDAWPHEAKDFTPWLKDNLSDLSDAVDIPFDAKTVRAEVMVPGRNRMTADIVVKSKYSDHTAVIENQLEYSDHKHWGQLTTYAVNLNPKAKIVIWVAKGFSEEHLEDVKEINALDERDYFAVEVSVQKVVGLKTSPFIPRFVVRAHPSDWGSSEWKDKYRDKTADFTPLGRFRHDFWNHYRKCYSDDGVKHGLVGSNAYHLIEEANLEISQYLAQKSVGIYIRHLRGQNAPDNIARIRSIGEDILKVTPSEYYSERYSGLNTLKIDSNDRKNWDRMSKWLHEKLDEYRRKLQRG